MDDSFAPPVAAPPLLSATETAHLRQTGHLTLPLPTHLKDQYTTLFSTASNFFALPQDEKTSLYPSAPNTTEQGYTSLPSEKEYLTLRHRVHATETPEIESQITDIWTHAAALLHRILADLARSLGMQSDAFDHLVQPCLLLPESELSAQPSLMRIFRYEPGKGVADQHRDLGLLTLCVCQGEGLEVLERGPRWMGAGEVTVLVGDSLRVLSSNRVRAGVHRVVANERGRMSVVFALRMATTGVIELERFGGFGTVGAKELWLGIWKGRRNINAGAAGKKDGEVKDGRLDGDESVRGTEERRDVC